MTDNVTVPFGDNSADTAILLLDAAEKKGYGPEVVTLVSHGSEGNAFSVPEDVAKAAKVETADEEEDPEKQAKADAKAQEEFNDSLDNGHVQSTDQPKAAKKTAAKKTANK